MKNRPNLVAVAWLAAITSAEIWPATWIISMTAKGIYYTCYRSLGWADFAPSSARKLGVEGKQGRQGRTRICTPKPSNGDCGQFAQDCGWLAGESYFVEQNEVISLLFFLFFLQAKFLTQDQINGTYLSISKGKLPTLLFYFLRPGLPWGNFTPAFWGDRSDPFPLSSVWPYSCNKQIDFHFCMKEFVRPYVITPLISIWGCFRFLAHWCVNFFISKTCDGKYFCTTSSMKPATDP